MTQPLAGWASRTLRCNSQDLRSPAAAPNQGSTRTQRHPASFKGAGGHSATWLLGGGPPASEDLGTPEPKTPPRGRSLPSLQMRPR